MWMTWGHQDGVIGSVGAQRGDLLINVITRASKKCLGKGKNQIIDKGHGRGPHFTQNLSYR